MNRISLPSDAEGEKNRRCTWTVNAVKAPPGRFVVVHRFAFHGFPRSASHRLGQACGRRRRRRREGGEGNHGDASLVTICSLPFAFSFRSFRSFGRAKSETRGRKETQHREGARIFSGSALCRWGRKKNWHFQFVAQPPLCRVYSAFPRNLNGSLPATLEIGETIFRSVLFREDRALLRRSFEKSTVVFA